MKHSTFAAVAFCFMLLVVGANACQRAQAHSWYPIECCSGRDCAEAQIESIHVPTAGNSLPVTIVKTKFGTAVVPPNFPLRESKDGQIHACMYPTQEGTMMLRCLFVPPSM